MNKTANSPIFTSMKAARGLAKDSRYSISRIRSSPRLGLLAAAVIALSGAAQAQSVYWDFATATPTSGVPSGVTVGAVSQGNNNGTTTMLGTTSASSGYTGASGTSNAGAAARTGVLNVASSGSAYFEFTVTPNTGFSFTISGISFGSRSTSTGPVFYSLRSSADSYGADLTTGTLGTNNSTWTLRSSTGLSINRSAATTYRIYGYGGTGTASANTANWRIDDLTVTVSATGAETTPSAPVIAAPSSISTTSFTANWSASSGATKYYLDVATDVNFTALVSGFNNLDVLNVTSYAVTGLNPATTYYYRVRANNSAGTSADSQNQVVLTSSLAAPAISVSPASLTGFSYNGAGPSTAQSVSVTASNLTGAPGSLSVSGSTNYEVSVTDASSGFASSALINYTNATLAATNLWIRLKAGLAAGNYNAETISISGGGAASAATISASGSVTQPTINIINTTNLGNFTGTNGLGSAPKTNSITGTNLQGPITIVATNYFEVSGDNGTSYTNNLVLTPTGGSVSNAVLFRIATNAPVGSLGTNLVTLSSPQASNRTVQVAGTVVNGGVTISIVGTNTATVAENGAALTLDVTLSPAAPAGGTTVTLTTTDTDNSELDLSATSVVFAQGETAKTVTLTPKLDNIFDPTQTIVITATATNWTVAGTVSVAVTNVDAMPITYISLTSTNTNNYTQNFDSLGTNNISGAISLTANEQSSLAAYTGSTSLNGWYATKLSGSGTAATAITADAGAGTSGLVYSYGATNAPDRALGVLASGSNIMAIGALIKNDTGVTINSIKVNLTAEFWRSSTSTQNTLTCAVGKVDGTTITTGNFLSVAGAIPLVGFNIVGPAPVTTNGPLDGNVAPNRTTFSNVMIPVQLAPGETAFVRWSDANEAGNDAGLAIDDLSMTASLEAATSDGDGTVTLANSTGSSPYALSGIWPRGATGQTVSLTVTPILDSTTLTSVSVLVPADFGLPLSSNVTSTGGAVGGISSVTGQLVTLTGMAITKANPGVINIAGLSTPSTATLGTGDGIYPFTVSTAGDGGTLKAVFASPSANVLIPIANIRDVDASYKPADLNKIVAVEGVCTWGFASNAFLQDSSGGVNAYSSSVLATPLVAGNTYAVVGKLTLYNGLTEITPTALANVVNVGTGTLPQPITITLPKTATELEPYEGMLVKFVNLSKASSNTNAWAASKTIAMQDAATNSINVRIDAGSTATTEPGYPVTVTGILGQIDGSVPHDTGYNVMPRTMADLSFDPTLRLSWIAPAPINENSSGFDPLTTYVILSRIGSSSGVATVNLSISPAGRMLNSGLPLPQTITFADGETSKQLALTPVDDSIYTGNTTVTITATATGLIPATTTAQILEDEAVPAPSGLSYSPSSVSGKVGVAITNLVPSVTGVVSGYSISPTLPAGLAINLTDGVISGTPTTITSNSYTVTATNASGSTTASVMIAIAAAGSTFDGSYPGRALTEVAPNGLTYLVNYAFGGTSSNAAVLPTQDNSDPTKLTLIAVVRTDDSTLVVAGEASTGLTNGWSTSGVTMTNSTNQASLPANTARKVVSVDRGTDPKKFLRIKVTK